MNRLSKPLTFAQLLFGVIVAIVVPFGTIAFAQGAEKAERDAIKSQCQKNTDDVSNLREDLTEVKTDVRWIRSALEKNSKD